MNAKRPARGIAYAGYRETDIALLQVCFVDYGLSYTRVLQHMLADLGVHLEYVVRSLGFRIRIGTALCSAIALFPRCFWHF